MDDDFDYLPGEQRPRAGTRAPSYPYGGPPRTGATGPQPRLNGTGPLPRIDGTGPLPRVNGTGPQPRLSGQANGTYARVNGDGHAAPRYQPASGQAAGNPPMSGPGIPGYPPASSPGTRRPAGGRPPAPGYPPANGRGYPAYPQANGHGYLGAPPADTRAYPEYPPASGPGYPEAGGRDYPGPVLGYDQDYSESLRASRRGGAAGPPAGKRVLGRLVLLPKALPLPGQALREHRDVSGGWLRPAVFGAMDGLVTNSSLIAGVGGGGGARGAIVLTGIAGLIAGAFSMATGEYISVTSQNELTAAEVELERLQHRHDRAAKLGRLTQIYMDKGVSPNLAEAVARQISANEDRAVATHVREELGIDPDDLPSPRTAAAASFAAFTVGALLPLSPFLLGIPNLKLALVIAGIAALLGGAAVAKLTERSALLGGLRQFTAAFLATGMAFAVGHVIGGHIS
jgi:VIT1/CCC1 family predicted Fe2+/Mn2+ transporter